MEEKNQEYIYQLDIELERLQQNLMDINDLWAIREPELSLKGAGLKYPFKIIKRFIRKIVYWIMLPYWQQQEEFNSSVAKATGDISRIQDMLINCIMEESDRKERGKNKTGRVIQIVSCLNYGDAVGNDVIAIKNALLEQGIPTEIYTKSIHKKIAPGTARMIYRLPKLTSKDLVIYHFAAADPLAEIIKELPCKKILRYHNVTPPEYFEKFDVEAQRNTSRGLQQIQELKNFMDFCIPVSEYNMRDLRSMGYQCPMRVIPILIQFSDYEQTPSRKVIETFGDGVKNIVFVGRIAPNKKIEDVIEIYNYYHRHYDENTRLILVGSYKEKDKYYQFLKKRVRKLKANNVIFTGHIAFDEILGYYKIADAFLCMSEHEGFCVPLVEAMYFDVPVIAYASTAVPDTLNGCGILLSDKDIPKAAKAVRQVLDPQNAEQIILEQKERLKDFDNGIVKAQLLESVQEQIEKLVDASDV